MDSTQVLGLIKIKGPVVPTQIAKEIKRDSLLTSAILSQLVDIKTLARRRLTRPGLDLLPQEALRAKQQRSHLVPCHSDGLRDRLVVHVVEVPEQEREPIPKGQRFDRASQRLPLLADPPAPRGRRTSRR